MRLIGLTGGIGTGKSTVSGILREQGVTVIDADEATRAVQAPGSVGLRRLAQDFGQSILTAGGELDRARLAAVAFADPAARARLNAIVHPLVRAWMAERTAEAAARGDPVVVLDIPLLFESRGTEGLDAVILVYAPDEVALERLTGRRGLARADAEARIAAQMSILEKRDRTPFVIDNTGDLGHLRAEVDRVWSEVWARF
ncbi:MAG: dephospho-CoA kinase [Candidatus Dormibacteraeota bacterium]|nr:dephospho-CoA kinase [Candidatus Dormibacteraeota bacterium]